MDTLADMNLNGVSSELIYFPFCGVNYYSYIYPIFVHLLCSFHLLHFYPEQYHWARHQAARHGVM